MSDDESMIEIGGDKKVNAKDVKDSDEDDNDDDYEADEDEDEDECSFEDEEVIPNHYLLTTV